MPSIFWYIFFSSLFPSFSMFISSKRTQNLSKTNRKILDVLFILIFISIVIYTSLFTITWFYLFKHTYLCLCSLYIILYELGKIVEIWGIEAVTKFSRWKCISGIEDEYSLTLVICLFSSVSLQLRRKTIIL